MLDEPQQQAIVTRLNRIEGQIRGIRRMVQEPRLCVDILQQLAAAEAALNRISLAVFRFHVERCVPEGIDQGEPEKGKRLNELIDIFDRFSK
jgi:CsoR family transcriptional regulator, copper-sensing transcriptional repressor